MTEMKVILKRILPRTLLDLLVKLRVMIYSYSARSYSQEGEDMILRRIFQDREKGFYIDVGAHHPKHLSNTYFFYQRGWSGINIDAMPGSMGLFRKIRPRDINIEAAIAKEKRELTFFMFNGPALNSFDEALSRSRNTGNSHIVREQKMLTRTLEEVLAENLTEGQTISFMSVDVEGFDLQVLESNNWQLFRPEYVLVECWDLHLNDINNIQGNEVVKFLDEQGYDLFAKSFSTAIFKEKSL